MKKKILSITLVIALVAIAAMGTLAYFTDVEEATNKFTVGGVDIELTEPNWDPDAAHEIVPGVKFDKDPTIEVVKGPAWLFLEIDMNKYISLINLMGVDAHLCGEFTEQLPGNYTGLTEFANMITDNPELLRQIVDRWFIGIDHSDWQIMNLEEITDALTAAAQGNNPSHLKIRLGYIGGDKPVGKAMPVGTEVKFMTAFEMPGTVTQSMMTGDDAYMVNGHSASNFNTANADWKLKFTAYAIQDEPFENITAAYNALFPAP